MSKMYIPQVRPPGVPFDGRKSYHCQALHQGKISNLGNIHHINTVIRMAVAAVVSVRMIQAATFTSSTQPWGASRHSASSTIHAAERSVERRKVYFFLEKYINF